MDGGLFWKHTIKHLHKIPRQEAMANYKDLIRRCNNKMLQKVTLQGYDRYIAPVCKRINNQEVFNEV